MSPADGTSESASAEQPSAPPKVTSPRGEEFELVGRAGPLRLQGVPGVLAEAAEELLVIKEGGLFLCARPDGDIRPRAVTGEGLFADDTRYLSELRLTIGGVNPVLLSSSADLAYAMVIDSTNPNIWEGRALQVPQQTLSLRRFRFISDRLYERITLRNYGLEPLSTRLDLTLAADYADTFEVRGVRRRKSRGHALAPKRVSRGLRFGYVGEDEVFRETLVVFDSEPSDIEISGDRAVVRWDLALDPGGDEKMIWLTIEPSRGGRRRRYKSFGTAEAHVLAAHQQWRISGTEIHTDNELFDGFVRASVRDLHALATPMDGGEIIAAGIPWFVAPFGRDSLLTCYEMMSLNTAPARETLRLLARHQARTDDPWRDAEPGKILHEIRTGELARTGHIPHTPYYGSVDSTPLFLMLAAAYHRWTADLEFLAEIRPALDAALGWIAQYGDRDGDGFVEYQKRSPAGLDNQGWKDSGESIVQADGSLAEPPIALVEVQGYVYLAKLRISEVYRALGEAGLADLLLKEAAELREAFNEAFWMPEEGTFALALDGRKQQVRSVTSNPGHCLYCDIVDQDKAASMAERMMAPDMFSGWGVRTLSMDNPAYNPMSYHNGSIWPHDNAILAAGLKRYGFPEATETIATALFDAAVASRETRLPELYCGFYRRENVPVVAYPVACSPQAWAAAVPFMLVQSFLGVSARAPNGVLTVNKPKLPSWLLRVELRGLHIGNSKVTLAFGRDREKTSFALIEREGDIRVTIEE